MASNGDNPRRDPHRPEDNPFIAFRRFADSQVSSLLNTVFTLPATIANYNNAHQAREQCLFGKADRRQCEQLHELESEIAQLRHEGRDLFRVGDVQAVLRNSEALMRLDRQADELRRDIVDEAARKSGAKTSGQDDAQLVERIANEKARQWGGEWDWGVPKPFDQDRKRIEGTTEAETARQERQMDLVLQLQSEARKLMGEDSYDEAMAAVMKIFSEDDSRTELHEEAWNDATVEVKKYMADQDSHTEAAKPRVWSWSRSWQWPPPGDSAQSDGLAYSPRVLENDPVLRGSGVQWRKAYADLLRTERDERPHCMRSEAHMTPERCGRFGLFPRQKWAHQDDSDTHDEPSYEYSHDHEDQHDDPPSPKVDHGDSFHGSGDSAVREDFQAYEVLEQQQERNRQALASSEHEARGSKDQQEFSTELDVYEQLLAAREKEQWQSVPTSDLKSSILSTLTTTERTVAPDGSVTTKVVMKKRFVDGREESSETVHTQRAQDLDVHSSDPLKTPQHAQPTPNEKHEKNKHTKQSGWFWSS
ncbi:hypothetical protein BKA66DRAFT_454475 [Pyrenochaeta sp. MPI-SDFR-AT-0127]|nr:hypothetical protein BKA66DRAFT_454475 [Pyrenochaeta sp. MPI-SDFR-AT-0127]